MDEAEALYQRCVALLQPIVERAATTNEEPATRLQAQVVLFHCYEGLAMLLMQRGDAAKGEAMYQKVIVESEKLVQLYPHPDRRQELAQCCLNLGAHYQASQQGKKAKEIYRKGAVILEALVRDLPDIAPYRLTLAHICVNLGLLYSGESAEEAVIVFHKGRDLLEPLWREHPEDAGCAYALIALYNNEAELLRNRGEPGKALPLLDRSIEAASAALGRDPTNGGIKHNCAMALGGRAQTWSTLSEHKKALADWDRLLEVVGPAEADKYRNWRALTLAELGDHRQALGDIVKYLRRPKISPDERYYGVTTLSYALEAAQKDSHLSSQERKEQEDQYAARALELLTQLRRDSYFRDPAKQQLLDKDESLAPLRPREDFKHWHHKPSTNHTLPHRRIARASRYVRRIGQTSSGAALARTR